MTEARRKECWPGLGPADDDSLPFKRQMVGFLAGGQSMHALKGLLLSATRHCKSYSHRVAMRSLDGGVERKNLRSRLCRNRRVLAIDFFQDFATTTFQQRLAQFFAELYRIAPMTSIAQNKRAVRSRDHAD